MYFVTFLINRTTDVTQTGIIIINRHHHHCLLLYSHKEWTSIIFYKSTMKDIFYHISILIVINIIISTLIIFNIFDITLIIIINIPLSTGIIFITNIITIVITNTIIIILITIEDVLHSLLCTCFNLSSSCTALVCTGHTGESRRGGNGS